MKYQTRSKIIAMLVVIVLLCTACKVTPAPTPTSQPTTPPPTETMTPTPSPTVPPKPLLGEITLYPGPHQYEGDILTINVVLEAGGIGLAALQDATLLVDGQALDTLLTESYTSDDHYLWYHWAWDTSQQEGMHTLSLRTPTLDGEFMELSTEVTILPADQRPASEKDAHWESVETDCCIIYYITNTAAARDIDQIVEQVTSDVADIESRVGELSSKPFTVTLLDNMWGNGAYSSDDGIVVTYTDRAYPGIDLQTAVRHEAAQYGVPNGPVFPLIVEGVAVYLAGGHYRAESIPERAAALRPLRQYIPLAELADGFYHYQHEAAYLEAAGLVAYLTETYGWESVLQVYQTKISGVGASTWLTRALRETYGVGLNTVEQDYTAWLESIPPGNQLDDLRVTIALRDTSRRYQELYAPYQGELLPSADAMSRGVVAEYMREPTAPENLVLETLLVTANQAYLDGDYAAAEQLLDVINDTLDDGDFTRQPAADYLAITQLLLEQGYEVQRIDLADTQATVLAIRTWPELETLTLEYDGAQWQLTGS